MYLCRMVSYFFSYLDDEDDHCGQEVERGPQDVEERQRHKSFAGVQVIVWAGQHVGGKRHQCYL